MILLVIVCSKCGYLDIVDFLGDAMKVAVEHYDKHPDHTIWIFNVEDSVVIGGGLYES